MWVGIVQAVYLPSLYFVAMGIRIKLLEIRYRKLPLFPVKGTKFPVRPLLIRSPVDRFFSLTPDTFPLLPPSIKQGNPSGTTYKLLSWSSILLVLIPPRIRYNTMRYYQLLTLLLCLAVGQATAVVLDQTPYDFQCGIMGK